MKRKAFRYPRPSKEEMELLYYQKQLTISQIAEHLQIGATTARGWLRDYNIATERGRGQFIALKKPPKELLEQLYIVEGLSTRDVAQRLSVSKHTAAAWLREHNLLRNLSEAWKVAVAHGRRNPHTVRGRGRQRYINRQGYVLAPLQRDDFFYPMADKRGLVLEHRLVMAKRIGRCLHPWESVHHRNSKKADNREENLLIVLKGAHKGKVKCPFCANEFGIR